MIHSIGKAIGMVVMIGCALALIFVMFGVFFPGDQEPFFSREYDASEVWSTDSSGLNKYREETVCLDRTQYLFIGSGYQMGITPDYLTNKKVRSCEEKKWPQGVKAMNFSRICRDAILYYQFSKSRGLALTVAVDQNGVPRSCNEN
ncbi:hypothetical protein [Geoalkalibacter subterraneus]|uniref:Uncharacterized protein n=1 Tax=Geoalkalibacter subterraneus TaxID=483547 RepID=A0A0B5FX78_9BACT|nr:hypothetical protein [Geoalkalibacter subterraneus]AJF08206.1 hypothetical protein GSUB_17100 [Geoalkalibacter subterraneus]